LVNVELTVSDADNSDRTATSKHLSKKTTLYIPETTIDDQPDGVATIRIRASKIDPDDSNLRRYALWKVSGGNVDGANSGNFVEYEHVVDLKPEGKRDYIVYAGIDIDNDGILAIPKEVSRKIEIIVMNPDIDVDSSNDGIISDNEDFIEEISPGKIIGYNGDDDNNNKTVDANEATSVVGEDDLAIMSLTFQQNHLPNGYKIVLQATEGAGNIKVWDSATKGSEVALETPLIVGQHTIPSILYIEGMQSGEAVLRAVLKSDKDDELCDDKIRLTVY
ncbi:MAG: hypothetical protein GY839_20505, partial [candidate division Zixibacteria bacterium]|nr:hypothetical protein [candidate division Zixibacteria bacterium]